jgi:hypothetical protein
MGYALGRSKAASRWFVAIEYRWAENQLDWRPILALRVDSLRRRISVAIGAKRT